MFSKHVVEIAERLGKAESLEEIEAFLHEHDQFYIYKTSLSEELDGCKDRRTLFGYNAIRFVQALLYRSKSLLEGSIQALNSNSSLTSILSVRAHFETTGSAAFLYKRIKSFYNGNIDFKKLDDDLFRLSLGSTTIENPDVPKPIQVMNLIDSTDEFIIKIIPKDKIPHKRMFRELYEDLSDFCHPNFQGISSGSEIIQPERAVVYHPTNVISDTHFIFFFNLSMSAKLFLFFYEELFKTLNESEVMPVFHKN